MITLGSAELAGQRRRAIDVQGVAFHKSEWMESGKDPLLSPTVFLVEQPADTSLHTHFHGENQFQVFVRGAGSIGRDRIGPVTVHYAGAYTGYGPLLSGPEGVWYFTIRAVFEMGTKTQAAEMVRGPKRHCVSRPQAPLEPAALKALGSVEEIELIAQQADGIAASMLRLPPGARVAGWKAPGSGGGQFYQVHGGEMLRGPSRLGHWETLFVSNDEAAPELIAGPDGLELLCLQMAPKEQVYAEAKRAASAAAR